RNGTVTATITVTNRGPDAATSVLTSVVVARGLTVTAAPGGTVRNGVVVYARPSLASGASVTYTLTLRAGNSATTSGLAVGTVSAVRDPAPLSNIAGSAIRVS